MNSWKGMKGADPAKIDQFLHCKLENMARRMSQGLTVVQQYLNVMGIFNYDENGKKLVWKRKDDGLRERALETVNAFFFRGIQEYGSLWGYLGSQYHQPLRS